MHEDVSVFRTHFMIQMLITINVAVLSIFAYFFFLWSWLWVVPTWLDPLLQKKYASRTIDFPVFGIQIMSAEKNLRILNIIFLLGVTTGYDSNFKAISQT